MDNNNQNNNVGMDPTVLGNSGAYKSTPNTAVTPNTLNNNPEEIESLDTTITLNPNPAINIGSQPPQEEVPKKNKMNKVLFVILIIVLLGAIGYGVYYYLTIAKDASSVKVLNPTFDLNTSTTDVTKYATISGISTTNCSVNITSIDFSKEGTYSYVVTCGNKNYDGTITIKDISAPIIVLQTVTKSVGDAVDIKEFISSCIDATTCTYTFMDDEATITGYLATAGTYDVKIKVTDGTNAKDVSATLIVLSEKITAYLACRSESTELEAYKANLMTIDTLAFSETNTYLGIAKRLYKYVFTSESSYKEVKDANLTNTSFDNHEGTLEFDDTALSLKVTQSLISTTLDTEYGSTFPTDYTKIKEYYETTKNYICAVKNNS